MKKLQKGMYVRCPVDYQYPEYPRVFFLGQIAEIDEFANKARVFFHDIDSCRQYYDDFPVNEIFDLDDIEHTKVIEGIHVEIDQSESINLETLKPIKRFGERGLIRAIHGDQDQKKQYMPKVIAYSGVKNEYHHYYIEQFDGKQVQIKEINEYYLRIGLTRTDYDPLKQIKNFEFHHPKFYKKRDSIITSLEIIKNITYGFDTLIGSRVFLLSHQIDSIIRAVSEMPCRFMLADEVGLGKTIEACVIMKGLKERLRKCKSLIIAPASLVDQWQAELHKKFWLEIPIWGSDHVDLDNDSDLIIPMEELTSEISKKSWDLVIVDEAHRLISSDKYYANVKEISEKVENFLLLSATPILERRTEYLRLLSLLLPRRYKNVSTGQFESLIEKQEKISNIVHKLVRDIDSYIEDELSEEYIEKLNKITTILKDDIFVEIVNKIDVTSEDRGLSEVRLALAYLAEYYQIEKRILRHRRTELVDILYPRVLEMRTYDMAGVDYGFYEYDVYESVINYFDQVAQERRTSDYVEFVKLGLSALFSSPFALDHFLKIRRRAISREKDYSNTRYPLQIFSFHSFVDEVVILEKLISLNNLWAKAAINELSSAEELFDDPERIKGRLSKVLDYLLDTTNDQKFVIFSFWKETLIALGSAINHLFGQETLVYFYKGMTREDLQKAADAFQSDPECRFILCDELGGEGRNFQIADGLIHIDLPWSPSSLEQRIGRLDRIGREKEVISIVFCSNAEIEVGLFKLWDEGLNIFNESISGLEIVLEEVQGEINQYLKQDIKYGLRELLPIFKEKYEKLKLKVDEERYYDKARQLDKNVLDQLKKVGKHFEEAEGKQFRDTMLSWAGMVGVPVTIDLHGNHPDIISFFYKQFSINAAINCMFIPYDMKAAQKKASRSGEIRGTFSRKLAILRENLVFFAPGDPFFDALVENANESYRGRSCAILFRGNIKRPWFGFRFTWTASVNPLPLLELGESLQHVALIKGYLPLECFVTYEGYRPDGSFKETEIKEIFKQFYEISDKKLTHLGKRDNGAIESFKKQFPSDEWKGTIDLAQTNSLSKVKEQSALYFQIASAKKELQRKIDGLKSSYLFYGIKDAVCIGELEKLTNIKEALIKGIENPRYNLESICFVIIKPNG